MPRANLQNALRKTAKGELPGDSEKASEGESKETSNPTSQRSRVGKVNITGYYPPDVKSSLRLIQAKTGATIQDILAEALNDIFAKYNVPETAPRND